MKTAFVIQNIVALFAILVGVKCWAASLGQKPMPFANLQTHGQLQTTQQRQQRTKGSQADVITRIRGLPKERLTQYKVDAAKRLQATLVRTFQALSANTQNIPANVRTAAKGALTATQAGKFTPAIVKSLPVILQRGSPQQGHPAEQLQVVLSSMIPHVPTASRGLLQGLHDFISKNLAGLNTLLGKLLGGAPDLLAGVIKSLTNSLGAITEAANGTLGSLGSLLGGALC